MLTLRGLQVVSDGNAIQDVFSYHGYPRWERTAPPCTPGTSHAMFCQRSQGILRACL